MFHILFIIIFVLLLLYFLAIMPKLRHNPEAAKMNGWLYAHRGMHNNKTDIPENSLRAFALAAEKGYGIELDVQLTKDQVPVILHDYNLKRACHKELEVSDLSYAELKGYRLFRSKESIPTFQEALEVIDGRVPVIIELKIPGRPDTLCQIVSQILQDYSGFYVIESFNPFGLIWYKKHYPGVVRGQLSTDFVKNKVEGSRFQYFMLKNLLLNFLTKPDFIAYQHIYKTSLSFTLCRKLYHTKPVAWTIQSQEQLEQSSKYFQLFIFDSFIPRPLKLRIPV